MTTRPDAPNDARLSELAQLLADEHIELGPIDRDDLRGALWDLIERRIVEARAGLPHKEAA